MCLHGIKFDLTLIYVLDLYVDGIDELADDSSDILRANMPRMRWSQWSDWSQCDSDCLRTRRRRCLSNLAGDCLGQDHQVAQCLLCVRTSKSHIVHESKQNINLHDNQYKMVLK